MPLPRENPYKRPWPFVEKLIAKLRAFARNVEGLLVFFR
jgi:hypothetical protein